MTKQVRQLSSGLRIQSAADDPSGIAIAESLRAKVNGLDQGAQSLQTATNALTVADGAMQTISGLLLRMRSLVVEARNDLLSDADRQDVQAEINQLSHEIDAISAKTAFNGKTLLDGSLSSAVPQLARVFIAHNSPLALGGTVLDTTTDPAEPAVYTQSEQVTQLITVDSYDPVADVLNVTVTITSPDPAFGPSQTATIQIPNGQNNPGPPFFSNPSPGNPTYFQFDQSGQTVLSFNMGNLSPNDVGASALIVTLPPQSKAAGSGLLVNTGDGEGSVVNVDVGSVSSATLGVNDIQISANDDLVNQGNEARIDYAISTLGSERAAVGAQIVSLQEASTNDNIASVNYASSESQIRDLNVSAGVTKYTQYEILTELGSKMIASLENLQRGLASLMSAALIP